MTNITHYEYRYRGAPHGGYGVLQTTRCVKLARYWLREIDRYMSHEYSVYAVIANGQAYKLEREMGYGPVGYHTQDGWVTI